MKGEEYEGWFKSQHRNNWIPTQGPDPTLPQVKIGEVELEEFCTQGHHTLQEWGWYAENRALSETSSPPRPQIPFPIRF